MPELAEVEYGRKVAHARAAGRRITRVWCDDDEIVFEGAAAAFAKHLKGRTVVDTHRHGKYLWFSLDRRPWPIFHFGMTGAFRVNGEDPIPLEGSPEVPDRAWPPKFTKVHLWFEDGGELVMTNARRLGRIRLAEDPRTTDPGVRKLGFDPYLEMPTAKAFAGLLERRTVTLKGLLLNQQFAAGVGNWIADEVLYQAGLDPRRKASGLSDAEVKRLHGKLKHVVHTAVKVDADKRRFPKTWLFHRRWGKKAGTMKGHPIEHLTVAGRTTAWVPALQS